MLLLPPSAAAVFEESKGHGCLVLACSHSLAPQSLTGSSRGAARVPRGSPRSLLPPRCRGCAARAEPDPRWETSPFLLPAWGQREGGPQLRFHCFHGLSLNPDKLFFPRAGVFTLSRHGGRGCSPLGWAGPPAHPTTLPGNNSSCTETPVHGFAAGKSPGGKMGSLRAPGINGARLRCLTPQTALAHPDATPDVTLTGSCCVSCGRSRPLRHSCTQRLFHSAGGTEKVSVITPGHAHGVTVCHQPAGPASPRSPHHTVQTHSTHRAPSS